MEFLQLRFVLMKPLRFLSVAAVLWDHSTALQSPDQATWLGRRDTSIWLTGTQNLTGNSSEYTVIHLRYFVWLELLISNN